MSLSSFFDKLRYGSYRKSSKASVYEKIAEDFKVSPQHVYEIAHGKRIQDKKDRTIFDKLCTMGIIVNFFI